MRRQSAGLDTGSTSEQRRRVPVRTPTGHHSRVSFRVRRIARAGHPLEPGRVSFHAALAFAVILAPTVVSAQVPDHFQAVRDEYRRYAWDLTTTEGTCAFKSSVAYVLSQRDPAFGELRKRPGQHQCPDGTAVDAVLYRTTGQVIDIVTRSETPQAGIAWQVDIPRYTDVDWVPAAPLLPAPPQPTPVPAPTPQPPPPEEGVILAKLTEIQATTTATHAEVVALRQDANRWVQSVATFAVKYIVPPVLSFLAAWKWFPRTESPEGETP